MAETTKPKPLPTVPPRKDAPQQPKPVEQPKQRLVPRYEGSD